MAGWLDLVSPLPARAAGAGRGRVAKEVSGGETGEKRSGALMLGSLAN
jgi:hypothetical protein